jgi:hypothetical protein
LNNLLVQEKTIRFKHIIPKADGNLKNPVITFSAIPGPPAYTPDRIQSIESTAGDLSYEPPLPPGDDSRDGGDRTNHDCLDAGGTPAWMQVVEPRRERRPSATHDHREVGGRVTPGAVTGEAKAGETESRGGMRG